MLCISCQTQTEKYKCARCLVRYCSLPCYKKHQDTCVSKQSLNIETWEVYNINEPTLHEPFCTEDTVPQSKLELLKHCETLHNLLYNPHLRNLLTEIDVAPDAWKAMKAAMQEPLFLEFADECLEIIEPNSHDYN